MKFVTFTDGERTEREVHPLGALAGLQFDELVLTPRDLLAFVRLPPDRLHALVDNLLCRARPGGEAQPSSIVPNMDPAQR